MFTKILAGIDGSECSLNAARAAARLARLHGATLSILHVCPLPEVKEPFPGAPPLPADLVNRYVRDLHSAVLARLQAAFQEAADLGSGVRYEVLVEVGNPVEVISRIADARGYDLIVVGTRGQSMEKVATLGSVSHGILCRAHATVLVVR